MSQNTSPRRSQRSNRRLPARFLDSATKVSGKSQTKENPVPQEKKLKGNDHEESKANIDSLPKGSNSQDQFTTRVISKQVHKVKYKTDSTKKSGGSELAKELQSGTEFELKRTLAKPSQRHFCTIREKGNNSLETQNYEKENNSIHSSSDALLHCESCGFKFTRPSSLRRHIQAAACKKKTESDSEEKADDRSDEDGQRERGSSKKTRRVCKVCHKSFVDKYTLIVHQRTHTGERPFHCTLCDKKFTQRSALKFHLDTHAGQKHQCPVCGYSFTQARSLKRHMVFHSGSRVMKRKLVNRNYKKVRVLAESPEDNEAETGEKERVFVEVYECHYCKKQFKRVAELTVHVRVHTNERPFVCKTCGKSFKQLCHLNGHKATHDKSSVHKCEDCGSCFTQAKSLHRHQSLKICSIADGSVGARPCKKRGRPRKDIAQVKLGEESKNCINGNEIDICTGSHSIGDTRKGTDDENVENFLCEQCEEVFEGWVNLMRHKQTHHQEEEVRCNVCSQTFNLLSDLIEHLRTHSDNEKLFSCENCNRKFKSQRCLQNHFGRNSCTGIRPFICDKCGKAFMYSRYLKTHRCIDTPIKLFSCGVCDKMYERRDRLIEHMRLHTGERPYVCDTCGKTFAKMANFKLHHRVHSGEKKYECVQCGKRFAHRSTLRYHEGTHSENKAFPCDECDKQFPRSKALLSHKQVVHGMVGGPEKTSFVCANCGKTYHHLKRLLKHFCVADGGKRFQCGVCNKQFDREKQLEIHMRIHTGEKPFKCQQCGKCFTQSGGLKDHMLSHTREKKFQCDLCDVKFLRMKSLRKHKLIIHTGVEPLICKQCGATFKYYKALKKHELVHGSEQKMFTDILEDIEQATSNTAITEEVSSDQAVVQVVSAEDHLPVAHVAEVVINDSASFQEIVIGGHDTSHVLHFIQDPQQMELEQSIQEIQLQAQLEQEDQGHAQQVLMAVVASVDHQEEVVSAS